MKKLFLYLFLIISSASFAQDKAEIKEFFWGKSDKYKTATTIPEKWKNESAVIIYKYEYYNYHKFGASVTYTSAIRKRIKLQDQAAVTEFSEFSYKDKFYSNKGMRSLGRGTNVVGIKIVKSTGKEIDVDIEKNAKEVDKEKKIAIANLEIGDIIDFYYYSVEPFKSIYEFGFEPEESPLGDVYPTMDMKLAFDTENDFFVNFNTYNGAPELIEIPTKNSGERKYELNAKDIEKNEFPRWFLPLAELPCYKFQVFFARSGKFEARADAFLSNSEKVIKKTVTKEDIFNYYDGKFRPDGSLGVINDFLKGKTFASDEEKIREVYYYTRHMFFTQFIEAFIISDATKFYALSVYSNPIFFRTEEGNRVFPDVIINLPDGKKMIVDSKVTLTAYERYINEEDENLKTQFLKEHVISINRHVEQLGNKNYHDLYQMESPDFVLLFIPIESAFALALNEDTSLYNKAFEKNIVIVTPSTLLATLRTIDSMWTNQKQQENALEIARQAGALYDKFEGFVTDLVKIGKKMDEAKVEYQGAMNKLVDGKGNLITSVEKLKKMGAKAKKSLPENIINRASSSDNSLTESEIN